METIITAETTITVAPDTAMSEVNGEIMLICVGTGRYVGLDDVASEIWRRVQTPLRFAELAAGLQAHFSGDPATIEADARRFVGQLAERELVMLG